MRKGASVAPDIGLDALALAEVLDQPVNRQCRVEVDAARTSLDRESQLLAEADQIFDLCGRVKVGAVFVFLPLDLSSRLRCSLGFDTDSSSRSRMSAIIRTMRRIRRRRRRSTCGT